MRGVMWSSSYSQSSSAQQALSSSSTRRSLLALSVVVDRLHVPQVPMDGLPLLRPGAVVVVGDRHLDHSVAEPSQSPRRRHGVTDRCCHRTDTARLERADAVLTALSARGAGGTGPETGRMCVGRQDCRAPPFPGKPACQYANRGEPVVPCRRIGGVSGRGVASPLSGRDAQKANKTERGSGEHRQGSAEDVVQAAALRDLPNPEMSNS